MKICIPLLIQHDFENTINVEYQSSTSPALFYDQVQHDSYVTVHIVEEFYSLQCKLYINQWKLVTWQYTPLK